MADELKSIKHPKTEAEYKQESAHLEQATEQLLHKTKEELPGQVANILQELTDMAPVERMNLARQLNNAAPLDDVNQYAGFWRRVGACLLDGFILLVVLFVGFYCIGLRFDQSQVDAFSKTLWPLNLLLIAYFAGFESSPLQATPGKMVLGIVVTDLTGARISFFQALKRTFSKILSQLFFGIGFIMCGFTKRRQTLHDMMVGTLVVKKHSPLKK
jgi:uncharacterized RDD family membrane protein YckC